MDTKKKLGQFHTTNKNYILHGLENFVMGKHWIDPFAGRGDLLEWATRFGAKSVTGYDLDPSFGYPRRDTLLNPPDYAGKWVIANPPYLFRSKSDDKTIYDIHGLDDLYKIAVKTIGTTCEGGILILPLQFLSSESSTAIRDFFFSRFDMEVCNVFEEKVFADTDYTVCVFYFTKKKYPDTGKSFVRIKFLPSNNSIQFKISRKYGWLVGEEFNEWLEGRNTRGVGRYTVENYQGDTEIIFTIKHPMAERIKGLGSNSVFQNIMLLRTIDTGAIDGKIKMMDIRQFEGIDCLLGLPTSRNYAHIKFDNPPSLEDQVKLIDAFNEKLEYFRESLNSVFLPSYRHSTSYSRKRIAFETAYRMINCCLDPCQHYMAC